MLKNFVISMTSAEHRREHIRREFGNHNISFEFFDAITPGITLDNAIAQFAPNLSNVHHLSNGEKACFMSHVLLWKKCIEDELPYIAIYEDDVVLGADAQFFFCTDAWIKSLFPDSNEFFILRPETYLMKVGVVPYKPIPAPTVKQDSRPAPSTYELNKLTSKHYDTACYIMSNASAKFLLNLLQTLPSSAFNPVDHILFRNYLSLKELPVYQLNPALAIQEDIFCKDTSQLASDIKKDRNITRRTQKEKLSIFQKLIREIKKIPAALRKAFTYKIIEFKR